MAAEDVQPIGCVGPASRVEFPHRGRGTGRADLLPGVALHGPKSLDKERKTTTILKQGSKSNAPEISLGGPNCREILLTCLACLACEPQ